MRQLAAYIHQGSVLLHWQLARHAVFPTPTTSFNDGPNPTTTKKRHGRVLPTLNPVIETINQTKDACAIPLARVVFGSVIVLLTIIMVLFPYSGTNFWLTFN